MADRALLTGYPQCFEWNLGAQTMSTSMAWYDDMGQNADTDIEGILPKGPYLPCVCMAGRSLLAGYPRYDHTGSALLYNGEYFVVIRYDVKVHISSYRLVYWCIFNLVWVIKAGTLGSVHWTCIQLLPAKCTPGFPCRVFSTLVSIYTNQAS